MMKINDRLMGIRPDEMIELTRQTRQILLRSYLRRGIAPPFWIIKPERRQTAQNGPRIAHSAKCGA
jgi:hypothetical protein